MRIIDADKLRADHFVTSTTANSFCHLYVSKEQIDNAPTIEAEPVRHGKWISHGSYFTCSVCGEEQYGIDTGRYYCQNCGCKMDLDEVEE